MPGLTDILRAAKDPDDASWKRVAERKAKGRLTNLARNGDFSKVDADKTRLADWDSWQDDGSAGTFSRDAAMRGGTAKATRVKNGGIMQWHTVETGQKYALQALCKVEGAARANVVVRWKTDKGDWVRWDEDVALTAEQGVDWTRYSGVVTVPKNARRMVILLAVSEQTGEKDVCRFDDVELYAVPAVSFPDETGRR